MDREFDSQHVLKTVAECSLNYAVPKQMQTCERVQAKRLLTRDQDYYTTDRKLYLGNDEWHPTTMVYVLKESSEIRNTCVRTMPTM
ncbi:hypothetical protein [Halalkalicoccus paucihalophilus]